MVFHQKGEKNIVFRTRGFETQELARIHQMGPNPGRGGLRGGRGTLVTGLIAPPRDGEMKDQPPDDEIREVGNSLLNPPSSTDELLALLVKAETILITVSQWPSDSTEEALLPAKEALISDQYLRQTDENIQVVVASCLNEIVRISAPDQPYDNDQMKDVFQLFMSGLKHLSSESRNNFTRAMRILEALAALRTCLIMMDLDINAMIVEMFQFFFNIIRPHHPVKLFKLMEMGMTLMIEESEDDEISVEVLRPLLDSVKLDNEDSVTQYLGKRVIEKCSTKLRPYLKEAVKSLNLEVKDYDEIIASLCQYDTSSGNMDAEEIVEASLSVDGAPKLDGTSEAEKEDCTPQVKDGGDNLSTVNHVGEENVAVALSGDGVSKLDGASEAGQEDCTLQVKDGEGNLLHDGNQQTVQLESNGAGSDVGAVNIAERLHSETGAIAHGRRGRKPNSLLSPEEGYEHPWTIGSIGKRRRSKNKESTIKEHNDQELRSELRRKIVRSKVKARGSSIPENRTKRVGAGSSTVSVEKGEGNRSVFQLLRKEIRDVADKMVESPISEPAKAKDPENLASEEMSRRPNVDYGEEMVNLRIMVWWPMDKTFYTGAVASFDPVTKKHKIIYDDDEEEVLDLREERWELFDEKPRQIQSSHNEEADPPTPAEEPAKTEKSISKRKKGSSRKQSAPTSSKRSKSEGYGLIKCGDSAPSPHQLKKETDEDDNEIAEAIFSFKFGKSRTGKKGVKTLKKKKKKMEP